MDDFAGKVAVVTGAASGIGKALALDFARRGMRIVAADVEEDPLADLASQIKGLGEECLQHPTDVSRLESVQALADAALPAKGRHPANHPAPIAGVTGWGKTPCVPMSTIKTTSDPKKIIEWFYPIKPHQHLKKLDQNRYGE